MTWPDKAHQGTTPTSSRAARREEPALEQPARSGEFELIRLLTGSLRGGADVRVGIGDDTAVVIPDCGRDLLLTCDMVADGVHFRRAWYESEPERLGRKALAANLSDVASMGGTPRWCLVTLATERDVPTEFLRRAFAGLAGLAAAWGVSVVGGDTVRLESGLALDVFLVGEVKPGGALLRSGAQPGDLIVVSGDFGLARAGLELLEQGGPEQVVCAGLDLQDSDTAKLRQLEPPVRLAEAHALASLGCVHALSDTSDGLATQVHLMCEASGVGAVVQGDNVPIAPETRLVAHAYGHDPLSWALFGGEDYELIAAVPPGEWARASEAVAAAGGAPLTVVGHFTAERDVLLERGTANTREQLIFGGWDHFRSGPSGDCRPTGGTSAVFQQGYDGGKGRQ
jgi:thiamine-monophosphate kinase